MEVANVTIQEIKIELVLTTVVSRITVDNFFGLQEYFDLDALGGQIISSLFLNLST
jgi:hypothetical protein